MDHKSGKGKITNTENNDREIAFDPVFYSFTNCEQQSRRADYQHVSQKKIQGSKPKFFRREWHDFLIKTFRQKCFYSKTYYKKTTYKPIFLHLHATLRNKLDWAGNQTNT
ncbi:hypothetical protein SDC9_105961 [bioreactor metagenome]|uniref:Uncharacterized protein n=1 Tax=bioreactor metagenome TaxID=1076179 RepID=A0A645B7I7_9ZZZZ